MALVCVNQSPGSSTSDRFREMLKACIEAAPAGFQQKPFGEVTTYVKRAAEMIHQAVVGKAARFPNIGQYFVEREVVKDGITAALEYIEEDKRGVRFNLLASALSTVRTAQFFNETFVANNREVLSERRSMSGRMTGTPSFRSITIESQGQTTWTKKAW